MDKNSIELYKQALCDGEEAVYNIRVMIVGHYGAGKTTLRKRLFGEDVEIDKRESTDGIDVHVKTCKVSLDTGQWNMIDKDERTELLYHRLVKVLKTSDETTQSPDENKEVETGTVNFESVPSRDNNELSKNIENNDTEIVTAGIGGDHLTVVDNYTMEETSDKVKIEEQNAEYIRNHLKELIDEIQRRNIEGANSDTADLSVWDFAGQFAFYGTHQIFLCRRAVYLLVTDISKKLQDEVKNDDCFADSNGVTHWTIAEFVHFWLNSIHEFCYSSGDEGPPVILVGTFAGELKETKEKTVMEFFHELRCGLETTFCHLIGKDFAVDNTVVDSNIERLKKRIWKTASKQKYWGEKIPAKWITLERILVTLKDEGLKVITRDKLRDLNSTLPVPVEKEEELEVFLKFHHESGNVLYFSDEKLQNSIILDPQWLIDAFKSLITAKEFCNKEYNILQEWCQFDKSAILTQTLIEAIWRRKNYSVFHEHKELLLNYLERLGIIAKPIQHSNSDEVADYYFAPCVLKAPPPKHLVEGSYDKNRRSTSKLCFKTQHGYFPTAVFNKLLAACIHKWSLSKWNGNSTIFCGCGIFDLQDNHMLYIYFYDNMIQIWLSKFSTSDQDPDRNMCLEVRSFVLDHLQNRSCMTSSIDVYYKCQTADLRSSRDAFAFDKIADKSEVVCSCRNKRHALRVQDLVKYWLVDKFPEIQFDMFRVLTEKDLSRISEAIGSGWQRLGAELGVSQVQMEQICLEHEKTSMRIYYMLSKWRCQNPLEATVKTLYNAMKNCTQVTFDYKTIKRVFDGN